MKKEASNVFNGGLVYDLNPLTTPNNVVTDAVNASFITFNGDELALQNDAGNASLDNNLNRGNILEYNNEISYVLGNVVSKVVTIYDPENSGVLYYQNINSNKIGNPNFTSSTSQWVLSSDLTVDLIGNIINNTTKLIFPTTTETIYQNLSLLKGTQYHIKFFAKNDSNIQSAVYSISHYNYNNQVIGSPTIITVISDTITDFDFTTPIPNIPAESDYKYSRFTCSAHADMISNNYIWLGEFELYATGLQLVNNSLIATELLNTEVWLDITKVSLSAGFYPLAVKEYGGVLYIISGKKGLNEGSDEIEFGSYPSPVAIDLTDYPAISTLINSSTELGIDKYLSTQEFNPGWKTLFTGSHLDSGSLNDISHYDNITGTQIKNIYKVGLYQKLQHSTRDLTKEFDYLSNTGYWFTSTKPFYNSSFYKGKLFSRVDLEPIEYFNLDSSTLTRSLTTYNWNLDFTYQSLCRLKIYSITVSYAIYDENAKVFPNSAELQTITFIPGNWTNTNVNTYTTNPSIAIENATAYKGCTLRYSITPNFVIDNGSDILTGIESFVSQYTIVSSRVIPDIYELVDLKYNKFILELANPQKLTYEYLDSVTTELETYVELALVDEENNYLNSSLEIDNLNVSAFILNTYSGLGLNEIIGSYKIEASGITAGTYPSFSILESIAQRIPSMTLQTKGANSVIPLQIVYSSSTSQNSITYLATGPNTSLLTTDNLTFYADSSPYLLVSEYPSPVEGTIAYNLEGSFKRYLSGNWQDQIIVNSTWNYNVIKGDIQVELFWEPAEEFDFGATYELRNILVSPQNKLIKIANYAGLRSCTALIRNSGSNIIWGKSTTWDPFIHVVRHQFIKIEANTFDTFYGKISGKLQAYNLNTDAPIGSPVVFTNKNCWFEQDNTGNNLPTIPFYATEHLTHSYSRLKWDVTTSLGLSGGNIIFMNYWTDVAANTYYHLYDCEIKYNEGISNITEIYENVKYPSNKFIGNSGVVMAHTFDPFNIL